MALVLGIVVLAAALVRSVYLAPVGHDEVEHGHVGFLILEGELPYRDFRQNHFPAYWLVTTPLAALFAGSSWVIVAGRWLSIGALVAIGVCGLRFLRLNGLAVGRSAMFVYAFAFLSFALPMQGYVARPDTMAAALVAVALTWAPAAAMGRGVGLLPAGFLTGVAVAVSPKMFPLAFAVPLVVALSASAWSLRAWRLLRFAAGGAMGVAPLVAWIGWHGIAADFFAATVTFNLGYSTPLLSPLPVWRLPLSLLGVVGALICFQRSRSRPGAKRAASGPVLLVASIAAGVAIPSIARNDELYNYLPLLFPWAVGCAVFTSKLAPRLRDPGLAVAVLVAVAGFPWAGTRAALQPPPAHAFTLARLQEVIELARPSDKCLAFAPYHPIFCQDVSELSLGWDVHFAVRAVERRRDREQAVWRAATEELAAGTPDLVLRRSPWRTWDRAAAAGLAPMPEQAMSESVRAAYDQVMVGDLEFWVRHGRVALAER